jgi:hypothetical protein
MIENLDSQWRQLIIDIEKSVGKRPSDLNAVLFLIGIQELGHGPKNFSKEQKQDLMHIATCRLLSFEGYYELEGLDEEGWPHWKKTESIPILTLDEQEAILKANAINYFNDLF